MKHFLSFFILFYLIFIIEGTIFEVVQDISKQDLGKKYLIEKNENKSCKDLLISELSNQALPLGSIKEIKNQQNKKHILSKDLVDNYEIPKYYGEYYQLLQSYMNNKFAENSLKTIYEKIKCQKDKPQTLFTENPEIESEEKDYNEIKQRRFLKKTEKVSKKYNSEINLYNSQEELTCQPNFRGRYDKFDFGVKVDRADVKENQMPFTIPHMYNKLFENPQLKYECLDEQNNKVPKPEPGFSKDSKDDDLEVQIISRTKRIIFLFVYHEILEICVADKHANMNSYWVLDRSYKGHYYTKKELIGNKYDTFQRIFYVAGYNGTECDASNFVSRRDHPDKPCIPIHTTHLKKKIRFIDIVQRDFDYGLAYPKYRKLKENCQHFAKNFYQELTNKDIDYTNDEFMKNSNFNWYKKMKKRDFPNWFFESMQESKKKRRYRQKLIK